MLEKYVNICYDNKRYFLINRGRGEYKMREGIHPNYTESTITCACGNVMKTNSTKSEMKVDVCSKCHPYWTGNLKRETTGGRADKFKKKYGIQ